MLFRSLSTKQLASQCSQHSSGWISLAGLSHTPGSEPFNVAKALAASGWLLESAKVVMEEEERAVPGPLAHSETNIHGKGHRAWRAAQVVEGSGEQCRGDWSPGAC